jgi:hypothetical protein
MGRKERWSSKERKNMRRKRRGTEEEWKENEVKMVKRRT